MSNSTSRNLLSALATTPLVLLAAAQPAAGEACTGPTVWHGVLPTDENAEEVYGLRLSMLGLWRPGTGTTPSPDMKVTTAGLAVRVNHPADLRRVIDFERYELDGMAHFALVYSASEAIEQLLPELDELSLVSAFEAGQDGPGLPRFLVDLETFRDGEDRRYAALFAAGERSQELELEIGGEALKTRVEYSRLRLKRLVDFELLADDGPGGEPIFAAVFEEFNGHQRFFPRLDTGEFHDQVHNQNDDGFRLEGVETWRDSSGDTYFAALFIESSAADHLWVQRCLYGVRCQDEVAVDAIASHLLGVYDNVADAKPTLRLIDIELPLGRKESSGFSTLGQEGDMLARSLPLAGGETGGGIVLPPPPTCNHAGLLHDGGTNGPPYP